MTATQNRNAYLDQVVAQGAQLEQDLRSKRSAPMASLVAAAPAAPPPPGAAPGRTRAAAPAPEPTSHAVDVRITGVGRWKTVVVPPNAFVVHTRRGRSEPLHVGLGVSFRFNPATDSYLVVPGAMQTILISAYCICRELQGVLVQAYVQWIIHDFAVAYRRLDFGDPVDPMGLVNLQLKEQAEAAIKDKVATISVQDVLSDKQPIIEELTARLRAVAEGSDDRRGDDGHGDHGRGDSGLGLRIVTVQIKEAVVSSQRLWENLQKPYRAEQERVARVAEVAAEVAIAEREMAAARQRDTQRLETERELADLRAKNEALTFDRDSVEALRRATREQEDAARLAELRNESTLHELRLERERQAEEAEMARQRIEQEYALKRLTQDAELDLARSRTEADHESALLELERDRQRAAIDNDQSPARLQALLVDRLPDIVSRLPKPDELRAVTIGGTDGTSLSGLVAELGAVLGAVRSALPRSEG